MSMLSYLGGQAYKEEQAQRDLLGPVDTSGIKFIPSRPANTLKGLPRATTIIIILDPDTLIPTCVMDGAIVSAMRTGAARGVAAKYLANPDAHVFGLVGASVQGMTQAIAIKSALPSLKVLKLYDIDNNASQAFADRMAPELGIEVVLLDIVHDAFIESDVIATATLPVSPMSNQNGINLVLFMQKSLLGIHPLRPCQFLIVSLLTTDLK